jgi:hypothetical protein
MADEPKMDDVMLAALKARRAKFSAECEAGIADIRLAVTLHEAMEGPLSSSKTIDELASELDLRDGSRYPAR